MKEHRYSINTQWTGNLGSGTSEYRAYSRDHVFRIPDKADLPGSADPAFRGDPSKHNPEEMLVMALSSCHMLWYLHLCADAGVVVTEYTDKAEGIMVEGEGGGQFSEVVLHPKVKVQDSSMIAKATALHDLAHKKCFIARSCNFPVKHLPEVF